MLSSYNLLDVCVTVAFRVAKKVLIVQVPLGFNDCISERRTKNRNFGVQFYDTGEVVRMQMFI